MSLDASLAISLNSLAGISPIIDAIIVFFASYLAYSIAAGVLVLLVVSVFAYREKREMLMVALISALVARGVVTELIRAAYHRPRPFSDLPVHNLFTDSAWSFPSGHATFFFALATAVYLYNKKWGTILLGAAILIAISRVVAGVHYPSDIVAGAGIGVLIAYLTYFIYKKLGEKVDD